MLILKTVLAEPASQWHNTGIIMQFFKGIIPFYKQALMLCILYQI